MEPNNQSIDQAAKAKQQGIGVPYPVDTIDNILADAQRIVGEYGTSKPISREEIAKILGKKVNSLALFYSTIVQYGIFNLIHGKGYLPTDLYKKYTQPQFDNDELKAKLAMFNSPSLYSKVIQNLNNNQLPADEKRFANILKDEPYNVNPNTADRAARTFLENARSMGLIDSSNTLKFSIEVRGNPKPDTGERHDPIHPLPPPPPDDGLFELPIPLPNKRKAYLKYPLDDLSRKDIMVIKKAIDFIASSIAEDEEIKNE